MADKGIVPLHIAAKLGKIDLCKFLLERKARVNQLDNKGDSPLLYAIINRHFEVFKFLIENRAKVNVTNYKGKSALYLSCELGNLDMVQYLVEKKADPLFRHRIDEVVKDTSLRREENFSIFDGAARNGHVDVCTYILKNLSPKESDLQDVQYPLMLAAENGHVEVIDLLVDHKADVNFVKKFFTKMFEGV